MKCEELEQVENPIEWGLYYDKSEVDAAITELKAENERLNRELEHVKDGDCINTCDVVEKHVKEADKAIARQKYKRCLAMAKLCHWKMGVFIYKKEKNDFYHRWHKRWLAIAEKFKTNSTINRKGGTNALQR